MFPATFPFRLLRHPATPAPQVSSIEVGVARTPAGEIELAYRLRGDMARLLIPAPERAEQADGLWEHTCFEAFVAVAGETAYREFNLSPSGKWAVYAFSGYRQRSEAPLAPMQPPRACSRLSVGRLEMQATIAATCLPATAANLPLRIGLAAVVEAADTVDGSHSYWALHHPAALPDFHHRDGFTLELAPLQAPP